MYRNRIQGLAGRVARPTPRLVLVAAAALLAAAADAAAQVTVEGYVRDPSGRPVADADLDFFESQSGFKVDPSAPGFESQSDKTDAFGYYQMVVVPEVYNIRFEPPEPRIDLAPTLEREVMLGTDLTIDVTLPAGSRLSGLVRDRDGNPVAGVDLDVHDPRGGGRLPTVRDDTAPNGEYGTTVLPGVWDVLFSPPLASGAGPLRVRGVDLTHDAYLDVALPRGHIVSGRVIREEGPAVYLADLDFEDPDGTWRIPTSDDATGTDGTFEVNVSEGTRHAFVTPPRGLPYAPAALYDLAVDRDLDLGTIVLSHGVLLHAVVRDAAGEPVEGADIDLLLPGTCDRYPAVTPGTDPAGAFTIRIEGGTYDVVVTPADGDTRPTHRFESVSVTADSDLEFALPAASPAPGTVSGRVLGPEGTGVADALVSGTPLGAGTSWLVTTAADGSFAFDAVDGRYDVEIRPPAESDLDVLRLDSLQLPCGLPSVLELRTAPPAPSPDVPAPRALVGFPNPWTTSTSLDLTLPQPSADATVTVYDISGRRVQELHRGALPGGHVRLDWNGRDHAGRSVASGVYFIHVDTTTTRLTAKVVRVRS